LVHQSNLKLTSNSKKNGIGFLSRRAYYLVGRKGMRGAALLAAAGIRLLRSNRRRNKFERNNGLSLPTVLVVSVTMACNYDCLGCYSRGRSDQGELSKAELNNLFDEAQNMGFLASVLTGGEPLMREEILEIVEKHPQILFILITNGSLMTSEKAAAIGRMKNLIVLVSIEGSCVFTDQRRGDGAHRAVLEAMTILNNAGAFFGFAATNNTENSNFLGSNEFINDMIDRGCSVGLITEYVPCGPMPRADWVLNITQREEFRQRIIKMRSLKPIVLVQFPQDEYGEANICSGAGRVSLHINSQGGIEPCPFVPLSVDNIRQGGLMAALKSSFLASIRSRPDLLSRDRLACSLYEHFSEVEALCEDSNSAATSIRAEDNCLSRL
jgi:MoaA/NifB/PqqE/SkfB family radical SAM enzyme